jgi:REP element-mobilizing transposase RayT
MIGVMARPLRIELPGGRYHVTARGNERRDIFRDDRDRRHFLELLGQLPERFGTVVHAYVLMANHYHLLLETPEANLSRTGQWLNVSYSVWFNRRHNRAGHLFQGRFAAIVIEQDAAFQEVGRYVHLNPVRISSLGLDKGKRLSASEGLSAHPSPEVVARRLNTLRKWKWSSYPGYAGYAAAPAWLTQSGLGGLSGGRTTRERQAALRDYTERAVREGLADTPWERLIGGVVLGTQAFAERLKSSLNANPREQPGLRPLIQRIRWEQIVAAVEQAKGERWEQFRDRHGDWGRDAALWLGRRTGRLSLRQLAERMGQADYTAAGAAVCRFGRRLVKDRKLTQVLAQIQAHLSNIEM